MSEYSMQVETLLKLVGGKENIDGVTHCITRMRFALVDNSKADVKGIENLPMVKGCFTAGGQFQVIIGPKVDIVCDEFIKLAGIVVKTKSEIKADVVKRQSWLNKAITMFAEIFIPLLPAIIAGGLILGFRNIIDSVAMFGPDKNQTLVQLSNFWSQVDSFLWLPGDAIFMFLPVGVTWSTVKRLGGSEILGIVLGICLVSPNLMNSYNYGAATLAHSAIPTWQFGFIKMQQVGYQAQVLPALFSGYLLAKIELWLKKVTPEAVMMIVVPFVSLLIVILLSFWFVGPIARELGNILADIFQFLLLSHFRLIGAALFGFFYAPIVITGLHQTFLAVDFTLIGSNLHGALLWPMVALSNICQGTGALAVLILNRKNVKLKAIVIPSVISAWLGVTEPAMYGVNLRYRYGFLGAMISSSIASMFIIYFKTMSTSIGIGGIPAILAFKIQDWGVYSVAIIMCLTLPFFFTWLLSKFMNRDENASGIKVEVKY